MPEYDLVTFAGIKEYTVIETKCVGKCPKLYRIDDAHPDYDVVKKALDRSDRSIIRCYHDRILDSTN